jgi:drug/metabolite transporter (DMT)-like permease
MIRRIKTAHDRLSETMQGIFWMVLSTFFFSVMTSIIRHLSHTDIHPSVMVLFRNIIGLLFIFPWVFKRGIHILKTDKMTLHILRAVTGLFGMLLWFYAITQLPMSQAIALSFTAPLFTTLAAVFILKEYVGLHRWMALLVGFLGVLVILRPGAQHIDVAALSVIVATIMWAFSNLIVKQMTKTEHPILIVTYMSIVMIPLSLPFALPHWVVPSVNELGWLVALGLMSISAQYSLSLSFSKASLATVAPFDFGRLIFVSLIAYFFFGEVIDCWTIAGGIIIFAAGIYIIRREAKGRRAKEVVLDIS